MSSCSQTEKPTTTATPPPFPATSYSLPAQPPKAERYRSLDEIAEKIERTGAELTVEVLGPGNNEDTLEDFAIMSTPDMQFDVYLFKSSEFRDMWLPQMPPGEVVYGPNWIIYTRDHTDVARTIFGGTIAGD